MGKRVFSLPDIFDSRIETALQACGHSIHHPRPLAEAVLRLSDHYTQNPLASSPWREPWAQAASIAYYFPLNLARGLSVAQEAGRLGFFSGLEHLVDMGSGMGPALFAFAKTNSFRSHLAYDVASEGLEISRRLNAWNIDFRTEIGDLTHPIRSQMQPETAPSSTLLTASYVLTELERVPSFWKNFEALAIIEPSTSVDGRQLMRLREALRNEGFRIWGPCTHEGACPFLNHSEKDWCHDRIHWHAPDWWLKVESFLPMKNRTLTHSYLLARKTLAPPIQLSQLARLTGDRLEEKGKTRQSVCRGEDREFLAWFPQRLTRGEAIHTERGSLVQLAANLEKKSNELRIKCGADLHEWESSEQVVPAGPP